jgi:hypothetical protein
MAIAAPSPIPHVLAAGGPPTLAESTGDGGDWDFSFHDLVSIVNPLQHIPVVSTLYRKLTGDTIKPLERIAGDTLYGGWMGLVSSVANLVFEKETGKDFGDTVLAFLQGDSVSNPAATPAPTADKAAATQGSAAESSTPQRTAVAGNNADDAALASSLAGAHIDAALGRRVTFAYRHAIRMSGASIEPANTF